MTRTLPFFFLLLAGCGTWPAYLKPGYEPDSGGWWGYYDYGYYGYDWDTWYGPDPDDDGYMDVYGMMFSTTTCMVDGQPAACTWEGSDMPNTFVITLFDDEYLYYGSADGACTITFTGDLVPGALAPDALYDWSLQITGSDTNCNLDPALWGEDPSDQFSFIGWEYTIEEVTDDTRATMEIYFTEEEMQNILAGRLFWDGYDTTGGSTQAFYGQAYPVIGGVEVGMGDLLSAEAVLEGADVYVVQTSLYYWAM